MTPTSRTHADLTILVNSSDGFEDCWHPFFELFRTFWPGCPYPLVLNTERKTYQHPGLNIRCSQVAAASSRRLTWSECLIECLAGIDTPYVLYLQEDYFLEAPVKVAEFEQLLGLLRNGQADVLRVMECGGSGPWHPTENPLVWRVDQRAAYRISMQAALWRKSTLRRQLRAHESPWQLEVFGTRRAWRQRDEKVLCVNRDRFHGPGREIIPYTPTGIVKGQWEQRIVEPLFAQHGLAIDFSRRGFYDAAHQPTARRPLLERAIDRLRSLR